jgi:hypothetical protein
MMARVARIWPLIVLTCTVDILVHFYYSEDPKVDLKEWIIDYFFKISLTSGFTS